MSQNVNQTVSYWDLRAKLRVQKEIHAVAKLSQQQCERDFFRSLGEDQNTIEFKHKLAILMYELTLSSKNKIAAINRQIDDSEEDSGIYFPRQ